ncbi:MAG: hypothetical protein AW09_002377 [Candidatus Accumulibacter phosphatis]|uniref:Uncharacterized protein n=1 Tax=Candidatus Accumulibacter phosphatis TaxID=327160 RepID=A0A080LUZ9_9PROT|nr:MAG: hypothetical protein AW09_002377 [Candidatus Accumulibacter phosphatis]
MVVGDALLQGFDKLLRREVAQQTERNPLATPGGQHRRGVTAFLRQVERHRINLEDGLLAQAGAIDHQFASTDARLVVELDAGNFNGCREVEGQGGKRRHQQVFHGVSFWLDALAGLVKQATASARRRSAVLP